MPTEKLPSTEVSGETLLRVLDGLSAVLLDMHDAVAGDPDVRTAAAAVAEQVVQQLRGCDGYREALRNRRVVDDVVSRRCGR